MHARETCTVSHNSDAKNNVAYTPGAMTLKEMVFVFCALQPVVSLLLLGTDCNNNRMHVDRIETYFCD